MDIKFNTQIVDISVALNALKYYRAGQYKQAIESLLKILDGEPGNWDARLMLAASYYKTNQFAAAERAFAVLNENCPDEDIRKRAVVGLQASTAKLHNREIEEQPDHAAGAMPLSSAPQAVPLPTTPLADSVDTVQSNFLNWLDKKEAEI